MPNRIIFVLGIVCFLAGCTSNTNYRAESLQNIRSRHHEMVDGYKYGSVAQGYYDETLAADAWGDSGDTGEEFYLLAIGIDRYKRLPNMEGASRDAHLFALALKEKYGFKVKVLSDPTRKQIVETVKHYKNMLRNNSRLVVYYAGRSLYDGTSGKGYWLPNDAQIDNKDSWISAQNIMTTLRGMNAKNIMIIAESCNMKSFLPQRELAATDGTVPSTMAPKVRVALTSGTIAVQTAERGTNCSAFTQTLIDALRSSQGPVKGADLYAAVQARGLAQHQYNPQYAIIPDSGHEGGDFVFKPAEKENRTAK